MHQRAPLVLGVAACLLAACGGDDGEATSPATTLAPAGDAVVAGEPFPETRCQANRDAGTITYLSGFDFAAAASIVDVIVAEQRGYFDELCLDVDLEPSFSTANYPIVAAGEAEFASGGSFSEVVKFAAANDADVVAVDVEGRTAIDGLILKPGTATKLEDLRGTTIGVKEAIPPSVAAMLAGAGLHEGVDYQTVLLDGFDPLAHWALDGIVGFPGYKSNEPGQLQRAGIEFDLFDPADYAIPGSFGVIFANREFIDEHPTAAQDFLRASMRGLADAIADPEAAAAAAVAKVEAHGNPSFLSPESETFRWTTDAALIEGSSSEGAGLGVPDLELLQQEVDAYAEVGIFGDGPAPDISERVDVELVAGVYDDEGAVIWPG
jgi:NitT/TauT family transport system substrate-binding protein